MPTMPLAHTVLFRQRQAGSSPSLSLLAAALGCSFVLPYWNTVWMSICFSTSWHVFPLLGMMGLLKEKTLKFEGK